MNLITVFLSVLIVALAVGNVLLHIVFARRKTDLGLPVSESMVVEQIASGSLELDVRSLPLERKIELAHKRIQRLERIVADSKSIEDNLKLRQKVERLDNFRSTVESEIIGIKEILGELQNSGIVTKARTFKRGAEKAKDYSSKEMHQMIYRSR
ncbi:MAG TPA: hypothetical protein VFF13_01000 [archaeon]|nr:hypothetical protein [archaeon]